MAEESGRGLKRSISQPLLTLFALGTTLGAGIYVVIGEIIGIAGYWAPLAFLAASLVALPTGASFAELAARCPSSGGPVAWTEQAFGSRWIAIVIGWGLVAAALVSSATVATGLVSYLGVFVDWQGNIVLAVAVGLATLIAAAGVKHSTGFMAMTTLAGISGLLLLVGQNVPNLPNLPALLQGDDRPAGDVGNAILLGGFLAFYAFIGFEDIVHLGEETRDARRVLPRAIFLTLAVSFFFYVVVSAIAVVSAPLDQIAQSKAPLVAVAGNGWIATAVGVLGIATIADGLLAQIIAASRIMFDLGESRGGAPKLLATLWARTKTPVIATLLGGGTVFALASYFPIRTLAGGTSAIVLSVFALSNIALIAMKRRESIRPDGFSAPSWVPWLGASCCLGLLGVQIVTGRGG